MNVKISRREWVQGISIFGAASIITAVVPGCVRPRGQVAIDQTQNQGNNPPIELNYAETDEFIGELNAAIETGRSVSVIFDGTVRMQQDSPLFAFLAADANIRNRDEFVQTLHAQDTDVGRKALGLMLDESLLDHRQAGISRELPSGEIIEPTTLVLVCLSLLIVASATVATTQIVLHGPVELSYEAKSGVDGFRASLNFQPA